MNIWLINHYAADMFRDKAGRHYWFAKKLEERGHAVTVFCASTYLNKAESIDMNGQKWLVQKDENTSFVFVQTSVYKANGLDRIKNMVAFYCNLYPAAKGYIKHNGKPDVIVASSVHPLTMVAGIKIAKKLKIPCVCEVRDLWPESIVTYRIQRKNSAIVRMLYRLEKWVYTKADAIIFTMEGGSDYIVEKGWDKAQGGSIDLNKVYHINNGVDLSVFDYNREHYIKEDSDLDNKNLFRVIYTGSIRLVNQLSTVIDVAAYLQGIGNTTIRFLVYGDGSEREKLENKCRTRGLNNIVFKGYTDRKYIPNILSKASINLLQYGDTLILQYGASMNKSFEYLAAGRPILGNITPKYDYIESNGCGIMRSFSSAKEYAEAILEIANLPDNEYAAMCKNARETAEKYDFSVLTKKLEQIIESL